MEKCLEGILCTLFPNRYFFAELIITDVAVKRDMHVPSMVWPGASNESASILLHSDTITCPKLPQTRQLLWPLFLICPHLVEKAGQSYFSSSPPKSQNDPWICY